MMYLTKVIVLLSLVATSSAFVSSQKINKIRAEKHDSVTYMASALKEMPRSSFEGRMRSLVIDNRKGEAAKEKFEKSRLPKNIKIARTLREYRDIVGEEKERIVVVRFYAKWCKACKAIKPHFYRLAHQQPNTLFVEVPVTESNANLHQGLGIPSLPFGHIYTPEGGLVEELRISRPHFSTFSNKLQTYLNGSCDLVDGEITSPYNVLKNEEVLSSTR